MRLLIGDIAAGRGDGINVAGRGAVELLRIWLHPLRSIDTRERGASLQELPNDMQLMAIKFEFHRPAIKFEFHRPGWRERGGIHFHVERR